jgi:resuscitation-promoting factor RpfB
MRCVRPLVRQLFVFLLLSFQVVSQTPTPAPSQSNAVPTSAYNSQAKHAPVNCTNNGTYVNSKGKTINRPENCSSAPERATAQCRDGTYSFSQSRRGTCSHHGGVAKWL